VRGDPAHRTVSLKRLWWSKFWIGYVPLLVFAEVLVASTNALLGVPHHITAAFLATLVPLLAAIVSLGLAFGAIHAKLDTQNAAQIATGFGAILYMLACFALIALVVAVDAWPVSQLLLAARDRLVVTGSSASLVALGFAVGAAIALVAFEVARRRGVSALARLAV
jgi:hypothetical protein